MKELKLKFRVFEHDLAIFNANDMELITDLEKHIKHVLSISSRENLSDLHKLINTEQLNEKRIDAFKAINSISDRKHKLKKAIFPNIQYLIGQDLAIQTQINLSIQIPGDKSSILEPHQDYRSGDSPFRKVIWIPLTECRDTNCLYMNTKNEQFEPIEAKYGEIIIFDPNTIHGNVLNTTEKTRVSVNIRIKNWFTPDMGTYIPDRQFGEYYEDFNFSKSTKRAFKVIEETLLK